MKPVVVITALLLGLGSISSSGCSPAKPAPTEAREAPAEAAMAASDRAKEAAAADAAATDPGVIAPQAPSFAVYMPGADATSEPVLAQGPSGPGGMVQFSTTAAPDDVIAFYRQKAEATGLATVATMNREGTLSYTAGDGPSGRGQLLNVVATPSANGSNVQLDWSAGN